jgi:predicted transcriptional regulator
MTATSIQTAVTTKKPRVVLYVTEELKAKLDKLAERRNRSVSNLLETLAKEEVERAETSGEI